MCGVWLWCPFKTCISFFWRQKRALLTHQYCLLSLFFNIQVACTLPLEVCPLWGPGGLHHSATNSQWIMALYQFDEPCKCGTGSVYTAWSKPSEYIYCNLSRKVGIMIDYSCNIKGYTVLKWQIWWLSGVRKLRFSTSNSVDSDRIWLLEREVNSGSTLLTGVQR